MLRRYWLVLLVMALVSPLGLLAKGSAWGEWGTEELQELAGFVPLGIGQATGWWQSLFPDYSMKFLGEGQMGEKVGYMMSAILGAGLVYGAMWVYLRIIATPGTKS
jgi:hypothetical protein